MLQKKRVFGRLLGLVAEEGDEVVPVLGLLETTEGHLGARNVLLGVLEVLELKLDQLANAYQRFRSWCLTRVSVFHSIPFCLLASE